MVGIFLAHSSSDHPFVEKLAIDLQLYGITVWIDDAELQVGDSLIEKIESAIDEMDYVGVILSPDSIKSEWVKKELRSVLIEEIHGKKVKLLPVLFKNCQVPRFLKDKVYADFRNENKYQEAFDKILEKLGIKISKIKEELSFEQFNRTMFIASHKGYFDCYLFNIFLNSIFKFKKYSLDPDIRFLKFPNERVPQIKRIIKTSLEKVYEIRKSSGPSLMHYFYDVESIEEVKFAEIPLIINDLNPDFQLKKIILKENFDEYLSRIKLEFEPLVSLASLFLQSKNFSISIPISRTKMIPPGEKDWLLYNENEFYLITFHSAIGDEFEQWVKFYMSNDSVAMLYVTSQLDEWSIYDIKALYNDYKSHIKIINALHGKKFLIFVLINLNSYSRKKTVPKRIVQKLNKLEKELKNDDASFEINLLNYNFMINDIKKSLNF